MLNFEMDPAVLIPYVPAGTELDRWNGHTFVSLVGFLFLNTRVLGLSIPFHRNFEEINLRFYVKRDSNGEIKRGVVFIKELVPRIAIAATARLLYNEKYFAVKMNHSIDLVKDGSVRYGWKEGSSWNFLSGKITGEAQPLIEGSEAEFITEHYWGYTKQKDGCTVEYQVEHPRWRIWTVRDSHFQCDVKATYGSEFVNALSNPATSAFLADGSEVIVRRGTAAFEP